MLNLDKKTYGKELPLINAIFVQLETSKMALEIKRVHFFCCCPQSYPTPFKFASDVNATVSITLMQYDYWKLYLLYFC